MATRTRFVFLMHPKEFKEEKAGTGRLTHLCLPNSEIHMGKGFDGDETVRALIGDPGNYPALLYPGPAALDLTSASRRESGPDDGAGRLRTALAHRRLTIFLLDATWSGARKMLRLSTCLQALPRLMFRPSAPSRYVIKQQPQPECLSTLEAVHELLTVLARAGLDSYPDPGQLHALFDRMQDFQIRCAADPARPGYRRQPYGLPGERKRPRGRSGSRRTRYFRTLAPTPERPGGESRGGLLNGDGAGSAAAARI